MALQVFTGRMGIDDPDILIISRKFNDAAVKDGARHGHRDVGLYFAPSKALQNARWKRCRFKLEHEWPDEWERYVSDYKLEMRESYRKHRAVWETVLSWERVVIVSNDENPERSARTVLARDILSKCGAVYLGELVG